MVKRFHFYENERSMAEAPDGDYVLWDDVHELLSAANAVTSAPVDDWTDDEYTWTHVRHFLRVLKEFNQAGGSDVATDDAEE